MKRELYFLLVIAVVATALALFERWMMERYNVGWGKPLPTDTWWGKQVSIKPPLNFVSPLLFTRYHVIMFGLLMPITFALTMVLTKGMMINPPATTLAWVVFILACVLGLAVLEDFLFFVVNSLFGAPYPDALVRLFRGEATWHPRHINFWLFKLPDFYVWMPPLIGLLLWIVSRLR